MKKKTIKRIPTITLLTLFLLLIILFEFFALNKYSLLKNNSLKDVPTLDKPNYYLSDSAIPYYTLKWLENIKFAKKGILSRANIQTTNEGKITRLSFKHGEINIDKEANVNYPFVVRIELNDSVNNKSETLYFSRIRYDKAEIYRIEKNGLKKKTSWEDIKVGNDAKIEESIDLLVPNVDDKNNFTDKYLKSLTIYLK